MSRGRRLALATLLAAGAAGAGLQGLGWLSGPRPWPEATGWDRVPAVDRPRAVEPARPAADGDDEATPRLTWLGHAGFLLRWHGRSLLIDPNLSDRCTVTRRVMERTLEPSRLGPVDAVLISHAHADHLDLPTLARLPGIGRLILPLGAQGYVRDAVGPDTPRTILTVGEREAVGPLEVIAVPAAHNGSRRHPFASRGHRANGYVVRDGGRALYFAGDTGASLDFEAIGREYRPDVAVLPIGAFLPRFPLARYHLSPADAVEAARRLGAATVVPAHFGTFRLSLDAPDEALPRFAHAARRAGVRWAMPVPGVELSLPPASDTLRAARGGVTR